MYGNSPFSAPPRNSTFSSSWESLQIVHSLTLVVQWVFLCITLDMVNKIRYKTGGPVGGYRDSKTQLFHRTVSNKISENFLLFLVLGIVPFPSAKSSHSDSVVHFNGAYDQLLLIGRFSYPVFSYSITYFLFDPSRSFLSYLIQPALVSLTSRVHTYFISSLFSFFLTLFLFSF